MKDIFIAVSCNIMPWSSPCKCPAHILYGTAIGVLKLNVIVLGIGFFQECFKGRWKATKGLWTIPVCGQIINMRACLLNYKVTFLSREACSEGITSYCTWLLRYSDFGEKAYFSEKFELLWDGWSWICLVFCKQILNIFMRRHWPWNFEFQF